MTKCKRSFEYFSFFALDSTLKTGVKKVFNFLGQLTDHDMANIQEEKSKRANNKQVEKLSYTFVCEPCVPCKCRSEVLRISQIPLEWLSCIGGKSVTYNIFELEKNGIFHLCYVQSLKCLYHHILPIVGNKQKLRVTIAYLTCFLA